MTLPYPNPTTREEARNNAIHLMPTDPDRAGVWSSIAMTFPEQPLLAIDNSSGIQQELTDQGLSNLDQTAIVNLPGTDIMPAEQHIAHVQPSGVGMDSTATIMVYAAAWDVLRSLAIRYVLSSMNRVAEVDVTDENTGPQAWDLRFVHIPGSPIVQVFVEQSATT